ncbi:hypothetical protein EVAR_58503_1 [Eumeta japonica]|uniref:Uncharacterized protein n=1 Tax=Eumeta variegata TaxID=151549 RepID=A0A4C1Z999_EUMVA|nr:hypothetical protein EVAR_58503_1 [Eumeta japonica]
MILRRGAAPARAPAPPRPTPARQQLYTETQQHSPGRTNPRRTVRAFLRLSADCNIVNLPLHPHLRKLFVRTQTSCQMKTIAEPWPGRARSPERRPPPAHQIHFNGLEPVIGFATTDGTGARPVLGESAALEVLPNPRAARRRYRAYKLDRFTFAAETRRHYAPNGAGLETPSLPPIILSRRVYTYRRRPAPRPLFSKRAPIRDTSCRHRRRVSPLRLSCIHFLR